QETNGQTDHRVGQQASLAKRLGHLDRFGRELLGHAALAQPAVGQRRERENGDTFLIVAKVPGLLPEGIQRAERHPRGLSLLHPRALSHPAEGKSSPAVSLPVEPFDSVIAELLDLVVSPHDRRGRRRVRSRGTRARGTGAPRAWVNPDPPALRADRGRMSPAATASLIARRTAGSLPAPASTTSFTSNSRPRMAAVLRIVWLLA